MKIWKMLIEELNSYFTLPLLERKASPLKWWQVNKSNFPILSDLEKKNLSTPANGVCRVATLPGKPGELGKVRKFENWPKIREKLGNFIKLIVKQLPIEQTSRKCWKQNVRSSGLKSDTCGFSANSQKSANYLLYNSHKSAKLSKPYFPKKFCKKKFKIKKIWHIC